MFVKCFTYHRFSIIVKSVNNMIKLSFFSCRTFTTASKINYFSNYCKEITENYSEGCVTKCDGFLVKKLQVETNINKIIS